jgi:hypothetical protein
VAMTWLVVLAVFFAVAYFILAGFAQHIVPVDIYNGRRIHRAAAWCAALATAIFGTVWWAVGPNNFLK